MTDGDSRAPRTANEQIRAIFATLPEDYSAARDAAADLLREFREALAGALQTRINSFAVTLPRESLAEKRAAATRINGELRALGLAIRCPRTGNPAILVADSVSGDEESRSRFRIEARDERGRKVRTSPSETIGQLELMPDPPRRESLSRGHEVPPGLDGSR